MYDEAGKFSSSLDLFPRDLNVSSRKRAPRTGDQWTLRAPMLALRNPDQAIGLPPGTILQPTIFVRNTTAKSVSAQIAMNWRGSSGSGQAKLPELQIPPFATRQLQVGPMQMLQIPDEAHWALVSLTTSAMKDDLIAIAASRDGSGRYGLEAKFTGGHGGDFTGGEWDVDTNRNAIAAVTNIGTRPADALLTLYYDGGAQKYELQQTIAPGDQMWVNLAQIVQKRLPDRNGNTLPVDVGSVTYSLRDLTPAGHSLIANELAVDSTFGPNVSPNCPDCCSADIDVSFDPLSLTLLPGDIDPLDVIVDGNALGLPGAESHWLAPAPARGGK